MEIGDILRDKDDHNAPSQDQTFEMKIWADLSSSALDALYDYDVMSFLPRFLQNDSTIPIIIPTIHNFMPFYGKDYTNEDDDDYNPAIVESLAFQLLGNYSDFSFHCTQYPYPT